MNNNDDNKGLGQALDVNATCQQLTMNAVPVDYGNNNQQALAPPSYLMANPNMDYCPLPTFSQAQIVYGLNAIKKSLEHEIIDHKANRKDNNDMLKSELKRQEMHEKAALDEKAQEKKAERDKEKILLKEDIRINNEHAVVIVIRNPENENRLCVQYQNASGKTVISKQICDAKNIHMNRLESYVDDKKHTAYRFFINGEVSFYIVDDELTPEMIVKRLKEKGYPISYRRKHRDDTITAFFNCLKRECDNYPAEIIPYVEGWNHYYKDGNEYCEFVKPESQLVFKQLVEKEVI